MDAELKKAFEKLIEKRKRSSLCEKKPSIDMCTCKKQPSIRTCNRIDVIPEENEEGSNTDTAGDNELNETTDKDRIKESRGYLINVI